MRREEARRLLGVPAGASSDDVDRRFRALARLHHPDAGGDPEQFRRIIAARALLVEPGDRPPLLVIPDRPLWRQLLDALLALTSRRRDDRRDRVW